MLNQAKRWLCAALTAAMVLTMVILPAHAESWGWLPDINGHWAEEEIRAAASWVNGYPDNTFRPDGSVTRAEFVKMLLSATRLDPGRNTADYLHEISSYAKSGEVLTDLDGHWLTVYGWTQTALDFGLIIPSDYAGGVFVPNQPATRCEAAVMIVRALGLVYPARQSEEEKLTFTDAETIPQWARGYVFQAVEAGVLNGYPDGSFQGDQTITRAEAVKMVSRALTYMEEGIDWGIRVFAQEASGVNEEYRQMVRVWLSAPAQVIDGVIYLPVRDVITANAALYGPGGLEWCCWDTERQQIALTYTHPFQSGAGDARFRWFSGDINDDDRRFPAPARLLYGELMVPVYTPDQEGFWDDAQWDEGSKTLLIPMYDHGPIGS